MWTGNVERAGGDKIFIQNISQCTRKKGIIFKTWM